MSEVQSLSANCCVVSWAMLDKYGRWDARFYVALAKHKDAVYRILARDPDGTKTRELVLRLPHCAEAFRAASRGATGRMSHYDYAHTRYDNAVYLAVARGSAEERVVKARELLAHAERELQECRDLTD